MLLHDKNAVIYGAAGAIGSAVARAFAREGARVHLTGRTGSKLDALAKEIGAADATELDALDQGAVEAHAASMDRVDISFNAIGVDHHQGFRLIDLAPEDYLHPILTYTRTQFLTTTAAARRMMATGSGTILTWSTTASRLGLPSNGFGPACAALEAYTRQLASELGPKGVRVLCLRPDGIPETVAHGSHAGPVWERAQTQSGHHEPDKAPSPVLGRPVTLEDLAEVAAFLVSDRATALTGTVTSLTNGALLDQA